MDYNLLKKGLSGESGKEVTLEEYLLGIRDAGKFDHKMNKPVQEFLSVVLDATIVKPLIESGTGEDMITGEDLSEFEKGMKLASGVVSLFTLGQGGVIINGGRVAFQSTLVTMGKMVAIDMVTTGVTYRTSELCQKMGMPGSVTMLLSMLTGGKVGSVLNNKWLANLSAEDAARFWKNLEPGEKLPPGMTGDEYAKYLKGAGGVDEVVTYRRVQGGAGTISSQPRISVDSTGKVTISKPDKNLNLSVDGGEHSQYFLSKPPCPHTWHHHK